ncbi:hypothetical protein HanIR_Chr15g0768641 [Helianthus annuus]|nr:hypothetical protein HanIR_Chr15g0768641 [Helianthus annuus]
MSQSRGLFSVSLLKSRLHSAKVTATESPSTQRISGFLVEVGYTIKLPANGKKC